MRRWIGLLFLLALASAQVVREGWVRFSPGPNAAAYLTLENPGDLPLRLVGARTPVAERVELHETFMREVEGKKVMGMRPVPFSRSRPRAGWSSSPGGTTSCSSA